MHGSLGTAPVKKIAKRSPMLQGVWDRWVAGGERPENDVLWDRSRDYGSSGTQGGREMRRDAVYHMAAVMRGLFASFLLLRLTMGMGMQMKMMLLYLCV